MLICTNCKKEMQCERNGVVAVWNGSHCYAGDLYQCPKCGNETLVTNSTPYYNSDAMNHFDDKYFINMDKEY